MPKTIIQTCSDEKEEQIGKQRYRSKPRKQNDKEIRKEYNNDIEREREHSLLNQRQIF
jgi:hypothetical protein